MGDKSSIDFDLLAQGVEDLRESLRAMVAGLVADGFTDREAREILVGIWRMQGKEEDLS